MLSTVSSTRAMAREPGNLRKSHRELGYLKIQSGLFTYRNTKMLSHKSVLSSDVIEESDPWERLDV